MNALSSSERDLILLQHNAHIHTHSRAHNSELSQIKSILGTAILESNDTSKFHFSPTKTGLYKLFDTINWTTNYSVACINPIQIVFAKIPKQNITTDLKQFMHAFEISITKETWCCYRNIWGIIKKNNHLCLYVTCLLQKIIITKCQSLQNL